MIEAIGTGEPADLPGTEAAETAACPEQGIVLKRQVCICNARGLHARAAAKFVKEAERFAACISLRKNGSTVSGRSIMGLMMLGAGQGCAVELIVEGWDAKEALDALAALIERGFDED
ncbi:MAG: HPr family phosphocarrier protein [Alphaproteobacteria bacterium]|nr:HPr family phosphocarrier protein [Alphaproteobacteria bacterium]